MNKQKINMTIGRFQPFTQGHLNMINDGEAPCIIYRINSSNKIPNTLKGWKVNGKIVRQESIIKIINYKNGDLSEQEKDLLKCPFSNELIENELEIIKRNNKNIIDVVYVINAFDAIIHFNKFISDNIDFYEPQYLMCGNDRSTEYLSLINKYDEIDDAWLSGIKISNILKGKLKVNIGNGRSEGISGTAVRNAIINKDKETFNKIMPLNTDIMFNDFIEAYDNFKKQLQLLL